mmetsp:Transcript_22879/g.34424  ORF Transcript_22879/g.34424 Transcript_22879/m.34424 type:complete len:131 (+) Transcript_22879:66-458(+)
MVRYSSKMDRSNSYVSHGSSMTQGSNGSSSVSTNGGLKKKSSNMAGRRNSTGNHIFERGRSTVSASSGISASLLENIEDAQRKRKTIHGSVNGGSSVSSASRDRSSTSSSENRGRRKDREERRERRKNRP